MAAAHGIRFDGTRFWVLHRRREYGPFDYEWSREFDGLELWYANHKFGEICSAEEIFADLGEFRLPARVVRVASVVFGSMLLGILRGCSSEERRAMLQRHLEEHGCGRYVPPVDGPPLKG
ncbi:MAG: hypothetical protein KF774_11055 [Planctomyces sp.]|nr:hypothetical protein [Planctomyces sp.]